MKNKMKDFIRDSDDDISGSSDEELFTDDLAADQLIALQAFAGLAEIDHILPNGENLVQELESSSESEEEAGASNTAQPPVQNVTASSSADKETFSKVEEGNWNFSDESDEDEKRATVEEVFEVEPVLENNREQPPDIEVGAEVVDVKFHPSAPIIIAGTLDSEVVSYRYTNQSTEELKSSEHHDSALRSLCFSEDGSMIFTTSKDCSVGILDTETFEIKRHVKNAHEASVYSVASINENIFASGDDDGILRVWDLRRSKHIYEFRCGEETVNSILADDDGKIIIAAVNDGSITALNINKKKLLVQSEMTGSPYTCMAVVRNGTRLAVGAASGNIYLYNWGEFGLHSETMTNQPQQINCMVAVGDNRVITGCDDRSIRAINFFPHRFVGVVGKHGSYGVESISVSSDQRYLASCCQDDVIKFWDLKHVYSKKIIGKKGHKNLDLKNNLLSSRQRNVEEFFNDMPVENQSDEEYVGPMDKPVNIQD